MVSFYIASSLRNAEYVKILSATLPPEWEWSFDWTQLIGGDTAEDCLQGAIEADVFIFIRDPEVSMRTAHGELGARLGANKRVLLLESGKGCLLYEHRLIKKFEDWGAILDALELS